MQRDQAVTIIRDSGLVDLPKTKDFQRHYSIAS